MSILRLASRKSAPAQQQTKLPVPLVKRGGGSSGSGFATAGGNELARMGAVPTLFAVVSRICEAVAAQEWQVYRKPSGGRQVGDAQREIIEPTSHAAATLLARPNAFMSWADVMEMGQQHQELVGESFLLITRVGSIPLELWPVRPDRMIEVPDPTKYLAGWLYKTPDGEKIPLAVEDVLHVKGTPNPENPYRGLSRIGSLIRDLDGATAAAEWNANFFRNSAQPGGVIEVDRRLSDEEFEELRLRWDEQHRGASNAHRVAIIEAGMWKDRGYSMRDMDFASLRNLSRDVIMEAYGVSRATLGVTDGVNFAAAKAAEMQFAKLVVVPRLNRWRQAWNSKLLPLFGDSDSIEVDYANPVGLDPDAENAERDSKVRAVCALVDAGWNPTSAAAAYGLPEMLFGQDGFDPGYDVLVKTLITSGGTLAPLILPMLGFELPGTADDVAMDRNSRADAVAKLVAAGFNPTSAAEAYELPEMQYGLQSEDPDRDLLIQLVTTAPANLAKLILPMLGFELPSPEEQGEVQESLDAAGGVVDGEVVEDGGNVEDGDAPPPGDGGNSEGTQERPEGGTGTDDDGAQASVSRETLTLRLVAPPAGVTPRLAAEDQPDLSELDQAWHRVLDELMERWSAVTAEQARQLREQIRELLEGGDVAGLTSISPDTDEAASLIEEALVVVAAVAATAAALEALDAGAEAITAAAASALHLDITAGVVARLLGQELATAAGREALRLFSPDESPAQIAGQVETFLRGRSDASARAQIGGALTGGANEARIQTFASASEGVLYAVEVLDGNTCSACAAIDGRFICTTADLAPYYRLYAMTGGYAHCKGGVRCRGTVTARWGAVSRETEAANRAPAVRLVACNSGKCRTSINPMSGCTCACNGANHGSVAGDGYSEGYWGSNDEWAEYFGGLGKSAGTDGGTPAGEFWDDESGKDAGKGYDPVDSVDFSDDYYEPSDTIGYQKAQLTSVKEWMSHADELSDLDEGFALGYNERLARAWQLQGFDGFPQVVSSEEFDKLPADHARVFRGIAGEEATEHAEQWRSGAPYPALGVFGSGTYTSTSQATARGYANAGGGKGSLIRMALRPNAKVGTTDEVYAEWEKRYGIKGDGLKLFRVLDGDAGMIATTLGFDAIRVTSEDHKGDADEDYLVIMNRTATIVAEAGNG